MCVGLSAKVVKISNGTAVIDAGGAKREVSSQLLFGASESALVYAYPYLMIYLVGTLPSMIATGMNSFINAQGYAMTGMTSVAIGAVANCILDPVFIFVFSLGIRGAAIATVISQMITGW